MRFIKMKNGLEKWIIILLYAIFRFIRVFKITLLYSRLTYKTPNIP